MPQIRIKSFQPLFYSPLVIFEIDDAVDLNRQLLQEAYERRIASPGVERSNFNGWHSEDDFFERTEPGARALHVQIASAVQACTRQVAPDFDFQQFGIQAQGWINILDRGGLNTPHDHPGWVWSGCYYVRVPTSEKELGGCIEFMDSRTNIRTLTVDSAACFASKFVVQPQAGMLVMFPSYLRHWVYPNESDEERVTIAFNTRFLKNA
jgi:uncharacterized protein (TIGR02466 family)